MVLIFKFYISILCMTCIQREPVGSVPNSEGGLEAYSESPHPNGRSFSPTCGAEPKGISPEASSTASDSPTPTNSVQERNWAANTHWHGLGELFIIQFRKKTPWP
jgi:hypothetical protein